jgi:TrmH family RNA methyltransferase
MKRITSRQNALVARFRAAARGDLPQVLLLDGAHLIAEAIAAQLPVRVAIVRSDAVDRPEIQSLLRLMDRAGVDLRVAPAAVMDAVSPVRSPSPIVALAEEPPGSMERVFSPFPPLVVITADVQDPGNVGAIIRVAEAAGASGTIAAGRSASPFGWKAIRGSMGSALRLPVTQNASVEDAVRRCRAAACRIVATVPRGGTSLFEADLAGPLAVAIGGEGAGLSPGVIEGADLRVSVPMRAPMESLNAAVTAALLLYEARRQRRGPVAGAPG